MDRCFITRLSCASSKPLGNNSCRYFCNDSNPDGIAFICEECLFAVWTAFLLAYLLDCWSCLCKQNPFLSSRHRDIGLGMEWKKWRQSFCGICRNRSRWVCFMKLAFPLVRFFLLCHLWARDVWELLVSKHVRIRIKVDLKGHSSESWILMSLLGLSVRLHVLSRDVWRRWWIETFLISITNWHYSDGSQF